MTATTAADDGGPPHSAGSSRGGGAGSETRMNEWFVPRFGPARFRAFVGMMFLPYTGMCVSFTVIGAMLAAADGVSGTGYAGQISWDRLAAIVVIYILALGISAHAADALGSKQAKPWGSYFTKRQLRPTMALSLAGAYALGTYYIILYVPFLAVIAVLEGFFLFAYNYEMFGGRLHNNFWFAISWGALPVLAGYVMQTNSIASAPALAAATLAALASYAEIRMSRPYKSLRRSGSDPRRAKRLEDRLKVLSVGTVAVALAMLLHRVILA